MKGLTFACGALAMAAMALTASCGSGSPATNGPDTLSLASTTLIGYDDLRDPGNIYTDGRDIYLLNSQQVDTLIDVFDNDGQFQRRLLRKGQGPDEVAFIYNNWLDAATGRLMVTAKQNSLTAVNLNPTDSAMLTEVFAYNPAAGSDTLRLGMQFYRMADGTVLASNMSEQGYFAEFAPDGSLRRFAVTPIPRSEFGGGLADYTVANFVQPIGAVSPDGKHMACYFGTADMIALGALTPDSVQFVRLYVSAPQGINVEQHDGYSSFGFAEDYRTPYLARPALSDEAAYFLSTPLTSREYQLGVKAMLDGEQPCGSTVEVYDFDGNHTLTLHLPVLARAIAVTPDGSMLYAIAEGPDGFTVERMPLRKQAQ